MKDKMSFELGCITRANNKAIRNNNNNNYENNNNNK